MPTGSQTVLDATLRPAKDALLAPVVAGPLAGVHPLAVSVAGLVASVGAAVAAWRGIIALSVALWLLGRLLDGLDGALARARGRQSDLGGLLDFLFDTVGYAAVPIGLAFGVDDRALWVITALLLGTFYLNAVSLGSVAALLERHAISAGARGGDSPTNITLPRGIIEGTETIVVFTLALALPSAAALIWSLMACAVLVTVIERTWWASRAIGAGHTPGGRS